MVDYVQYYGGIQMNLYSNPDGPASNCIGLKFEVFSLGTLWAAKNKKRSKDGLNVNRKPLNKLLTDVEPEINMTVYVFYGD